MPNGDALYEEEKQRISEELQKNVTAGDETERRDDYHRYYSVHEGEQFFFSSAYANRGDQYSIRTVARNYVGEKRKPVLNETGSKSERKKRKQDYEKDLKEWEDAKQRQSYYDEASQSIETQIVETRSAGRPESPASEEDRWIGIPLEKRTEEDMARLSGDERAEAMEAEAFYPEMFAEINGARDLIAREHSETEGRDATSKKIYGRLARRLAEASNSYALNEREEIALRKIDPAALRQRMKSAAPDAGTGDAWMKEAIGAKLAVQKRARDILREEIRTIGRLLDIAGGDASAGGLTEEDERYLSLNGIDAGAFREIGVRREGHVSDIQRAKDEAETRRREEEEAQRREVDRLRQEEEDRIRLAKEEEDRKAAEAERIRLAKEEEERKAAEAERLRMLEAKAAEFGEQLDKKFLKYSKSADKRKTNLSRFEPKATHRARHLVKHLSHLNAAITTFRKENEYEGVLIGAFEEKAQSIEKLQGDVNGAIGIAQENYQTKIKADVAALKSAEERTDLLVDAGESEYCNAASKVLFGTMINEAIDGDSVLTAVANDMETTFKEIRAALAEARDKGTDEAKGRKISRQERFEYMKRIDSLFARLESQQAALQSLKIETAEEDADADPVVAEKNSHRATILKNREKAYGTAIMAATADRAALVFTKYERAIGRRTDIGRDLFKTADEIETKRLAEAKLTKDELNDLIKSISAGTLNETQINTLRANFDIFLTKKYRALGDVEACLKKAAVQGAALSDEEKATLEAAARYILTTEDRAELEKTLKKASASTLKELNEDLDTLDVTKPEEQKKAAEQKKTEAQAEGQPAFKKTKKTLAMEEKEAEKAKKEAAKAKKKEPEERLKAAFTIGGKLSSLRRIGQKNLLSADYDTFAGRIEEISKANLPQMKEQIKGKYAYTDSEYLDRLLLDAELHPGVLQQLSEMSAQNQEKLLAVIYGEDKQKALAAIDKLLIGREDLDDLAIFLKSKALKSRAEGVKDEKDETARKAQEDKIKREFYSMTTAHDASRLARTCRGMICNMKEKNSKNRAFSDRMEQLESLEDKPLIEALLRIESSFSGDDRKTLSQGGVVGMEFLYLNAYALILSSENGKAVTAEDIQNTTAGAGYSLETINKALESKLAREGQYDKAKELLDDQMSIYDGNGWGNRFWNLIGNVINKDLSRERLGIRALSAMANAEDQSEARELQMQLARDVYKTQTGGGFDPASANLLTMSMQKTFEGYFLKEDFGHQLSLAAGASQYAERREEAQKARDEGKKQRRDAKEGARTAQIEDLRKRERASRASYGEKNLTSIDALIAARDKRREAITAEKAKDKKEGHPIVEGGVALAVSVLSVYKLIESMKKDYEGRDAAGPTEPDDATIAIAIAIAKDLREKMTKALGDHYDLDAMTKDEDKREGSDAEKKRRQLKDLLDIEEKYIKDGKFNSGQFFEDANALFAGSDLVNRANAALLIFMENAPKDYDYAADVKKIIGGAETIKAKPQIKEQVRAKVADLTFNASAVLTSLIGQANRVKTDRPAPESPAIQQAEEELRGLEALNAERKAKKKEYKKLEGSDAERRAKRKEYRALKDPAEDIAKKKEEIRALRDSVAADQGLADARLRRGDGQADDNVSTEPALLIHALYIALRDVTDPGFDHMDESKREELFKKKKSLIGDLKAKASTGDFVFNLRAMTRDKKGTLNESEGTAAQWDAFLKRLNAVAEAKNAVAFSVEAKALNDYIEDNKIRETADAALRSDIAPTTGEAIDKQIDGLIGSGLLIGKDRDGEKAALKEVYRKALEERMKGKHGQGDALLAADLVKNAREERKDAGIDDDETGARPALTIDAICLELTIITATPFKNMKPEEKNALKEQRDVFKGLSAKLHSFGDMNFFAMTVDRDKSKRTRDVQKLSDDFNAMLKYVTDAKSDEDFIARAAEMRDFVQWYDLPSRADAVMKAEAPVSEKLRRVDLDGVLGESTDSKPEQRQSEKQRLRKAVETPYALYGANRQKSATAETDVTGVELVFRAREERETKYGIKTDKVGGATFALTVLAIHNLARDTSGDAISGGLDDYKASFRALRDNLDTFFNLEAMTDDNKDKLEDSHVQRLREDYKGLIDAIGSCNTIGALRAKTLELYNFSMANSLQLRAEAAIELKPAEQEFSEKLDHAVGKQGQKDTRLSGIRTELNQLYADRIGVQAVSFEDASSLLSAEMKDKLDKITKIVVIGEFRSILPPKPFDEFMKDLQDSESDVFKRVTERIGAALADAEFEKKDKLGGAVKGSRYRPLEKKGAKGVSSERSAALARHLVNKFTGEVKDSKKTAKEWLGGQADMQQAESSRQQRQVEKAFGAEAAEAYKSTVVIGSIVDGLAERVGKDKTLHISNYAGGSLGVSAEVSEVSGSVDLALTVENDLSISHGSDGRWSIYIGGKLQADFGARISTDIGVASLGAGINVNLSGTNAMKLDFADESKCKEFLNSFFMGYDRSAPRGEDPGATPAQRSMLGLSERITPIRVIAGGVSLDASVSLSDKAGEILGETIERIPGVEEVKEAVTGVAENMKGRVEGFLNPVAESVAAFTEKKGGAAYKYLSSGTKEALSGFIKNARLPASVDRNGLQSELEEIFSNLDETIDGLIQEKIKERIEKFPGVAYDGIQEKITEKVKEALEDKVRTILVLLGAEAVKEDDQDDEKKGDEKKDDEKKGDEKKDDEKKDDEKKDDEKGVAGTIKEGASGVAGAIKEEAGDAAGKIKEKVGDPVKEKIVAAVKEKAEKTIASMFGSTFASILSEEEKGTADEEGEEEKEEEKEEEEDKKKAIDAELAAKLSLGGRYETSRPAANKETVIVSMDVAASASASLTAVGVSLSKSAEGSFSASIERRFTDDKLTGATMARTYKIGGDTAAKDAKEILASFGLANAALESDLGGEYAGFKEMTLVVEADMTQDGMRKYRESAAKGKTVNDMFILSDRDNYAGMRVRLETVLDEASYERALSAEVKVDALGEGGAVRAGFKKGAKGELLEYRRYNARKRKEKKKSA